MTGTGERYRRRNGGKVKRIWDWEMACLGKAGVDLGLAEVVVDGGAAANSWMVRSCGIPNTYMEAAAGGHYHPAAQRGVFRH
jgi:hypothetical protein